MVTAASHSATTINPKAASTAFAVALRILERWGCTGSQAQSILQMARSTYQKNKAAPEHAKLSADQLRRVSYILNMHQALRIVFDNPENTYGFMTMANHNPFFNGRKPLDVMASGDFGDLYEVYKRVDSLRGAGL